MSAEPSTVVAEAEVCASALPVLIRHINTAKEQAEQAVRALNSHFITVMRQLQEMSALATTMHQGGTATFERIDEEFMMISDAQTQLAQEHSQLAGRTAALAPELSRLLAIAREVGDERLTLAVEGVATRIFSIAEDHANLAEAAAQCVHRTDARVDAVLGPYGESLSKLAQCGDVMRAEVSECLVQLQFQDRISQILGHATSSMTLLGRYLERPTARDFTRTSILERFMAEMASGYTTEEQFSNHTESSSSSDSES